MVPGPWKALLGNKGLKFPHPHLTHHPYLTCKLHSSLKLPENTAHERAAQGPFKSRKLRLAGVGPGLPESRRPKGVPCGWGCTHSLSKLHQVLSWVL